MEPAANTGGRSTRITAEPSDADAALVAAVFECLEFSHSICVNETDPAAPADAEHADQPFGNSQYDVFA